jgi:hypothetical protein
MAAEDTPAVRADVRSMFQEAARVLRPGGLYVCVTLAQEHVLRSVLSFPGVGLEDPSPPQHWSVHVHVLDGMRSETSSLCPVAAVCRKPEVPQAHPNQLRLVSPGGVSDPVSPDVISGTIREAQWMYNVRQKARRVEKGNTFTLDVWATGFDAPRYTVTALDISRKQSCGVLLVPQGREHEWSFANVDGMTTVVEGSGFGRLYFVYLNRGHTFPSQEAIKVCGGVGLSRRSCTPRCVPFVL